MMARKPLEDSRHCLVQELMVANFAKRELILLDSILLQPWLPRSWPARAAVRSQEILPGQRRRQVLKWLLWANGSYQFASALHSHGYVHLHPNLHKTDVSHVATCLRQGR